MFPIACVCMFHLLVVLKHHKSLFFVFFLNAHYSGEAVITAVKQVCLVGMKKHIGVWVFLHLGTIRTALSKTLLN